MAKEIDMRKIYIQACIDCGFLPSQKKVDTFKPTYLDITEIDIWNQQDL